MAIGFDKALGIHEHALQFRASRAELIANNMANSDTPNFKARDIDFKQVFADFIESDGSSLRMAETNDKHSQSGRMQSIDGDLLYRVPGQPSIDGNTVDEHIENAAFMENSLDFQASFTFLNSKFKGLISAIRGE